MRDTVWPNSILLMPEHKPTGCEWCSAVSRHLKGRQQRNFLRLLRLLIAVSLAGAVVSAL